MKKSQREKGFDHPDQGVVGRYEQQEAQIGDTASDGQLSFRSLREGWQVDNFAKDWARFGIKFRI